MLFSFLRRATELKSEDTRKYRYVGRGTDKEKTSGSVVQVLSLMKAAKSSAERTAKALQKAEDDLPKPG